MVLLIHAADRRLVPVLVLIVSDPGFAFSFSPVTLDSLSDLILVLVLNLVPACFCLSFFFLCSSSRFRPVFCFVLYFFLVLVSMLNLFRGLGLVLVLVPLAETCETLHSNTGHSYRMF